MRRYWLSWTESGVDPRPIAPHLLSRGIVAWWCSGYGQIDDAEYCVMVAVVDAQDDGDAKDAIRMPGAWKPRDWRFCDRKEPGWMPDPERFPFKTSPPKSLSESTGG
jgi:hypothetical protein